METRCKEEAYNKVFAILDTMQEEPVSEDLEEEIEQYCLHHGYLDSFKDCSYTFNEQVGDIARYFANWQKEHLMKDAIDGEVLENYDGKVLEYDDSIFDEKLSNYKVFDKVKVVVIKVD